ncbi:uncharacterized protein LOC132731626 [Ruditapes philippinarum]|uniref:uncharacterized protein LOC132731626 n=1 Tax=Ruditapes philippinarum TaxID=129788 RepID=UPI00295BC2FA|nr:uncharacterized protein LOC132731626 [Ruditapes philippinarum]
MENNTIYIVEELNRNLTMVVLPVTIFIGIEAFIGLFGNILILLIYTKRYERSNFRYFVLSMAVIDLTSCLTTLPGEIFSQMNWYTYKYDWICRVKSYINVQTAWGSASILLLLAFDRYRKICKPLAWQIQPSFALKLCICSIILASMVAIPISILWGKQTYIYQHNGLNLTVSICEKSGEYANDIYPFVYICCVYILPVGLILFVVCSLNIITARKLFGKKSLSLALPVTNGISSVYTSDASLTTVATDTDIESVNTEPLTITRHLENGEENGTHNLTNLEENNSSPDCEAGKEDANDYEDRRSESKTNVHTRVSFISNRNKRGGSCSGQSSNRDIDFHFDIDIRSHFVKDDVKKDRNTAEVSTRPIKVHDNSFSNINKHVDHRRQKSGHHRVSDFRRKQKTVIMLVLTIVFVITMLLYVILISFVAGTEGILKTLSNPQKVVFFFFWRLYFINTVINPILYGILDPRFRTGMRAIFKGKQIPNRNDSKNHSQSSSKRKKLVFTLG